VTEPRRLGDLLVEVQRTLDRGRKATATPARPWHYRLRGWWLRGRVRTLAVVARHTERAVRGAYDRLATHDSA
jgi:hypothetical protein